jgi:signal transduction histidine kinase
LSKVSLLHSVVGRVVAVTALGATAIGATLALFFAANASLRNANEQNARATAINAAALNLRSHVVDLANAFEDVVAGNGKQALARWKAAEQSWRQPAAELTQAAAPNQGLQSEALSVRANIEAFITDYGEPVIAIARISPALARSSTSSAERQFRISQILTTTDTMAKIAVDQAVRSSASANRLAHRAQIAGLAAVVFAPLLLVGLAIWLARSVAAPLRRTVNAASEVAAGHFDVRLDERRSDEFGELGRAFNAMTESLAASHDELVTRAESLEQAERHKTELISMVSHEIRTPLASILGFTRLLLERDVEEDARRRYLEIIDAEATRLASLVSDFLDARLIESGQFALRPELFDARALVLEQAELALIHDEAHDLDLQLHETPLLVQADRHRLTQVVANVLSNAIKYSPAGGTITVGAAPSSTGARLWVDDEGTGIAPEHRAQIFEPFFRGGAADAGIPGTGLGLAVSRRIVEAHGGTMGFEALPDGTRFWVELPLEQPLSPVGADARREAPSGVSTS